MYSVFIPVSFEGIF